MNWLTDWLQRRKDEAAKEAFARGFDWCAGELLRGKEPAALERNLDFTFDSTSFDYGAQAALQAWYARATIDKAALDSLVYGAEGCGCASHH